MPRPSDFKLWREVRSNLESSKSHPCHRIINLFQRNSDFPLASFLPLGCLTFEGSEDPQLRSSSLGHCF